eukprot:1585993-Rhodomonas_salina.1
MFDALMFGWMFWRAGMARVGPGEGVQDAAASVRTSLQGWRCHRVRQWQVDGIVSPSSRFRQLPAGLCLAFSSNTPTAQATNSSAGPELSEVVPAPAGPAMGALVCVGVCRGTDRRDVHVLVVQ